jgi:FMN phosphatase YigB (HAD superfamily)
MNYKAILFDLDGTLLPMDNDVFTKGYFKGLCKKLAHFGLDSQELVSAVWAGTKAMVVNDGSKSNEAAFWERFEQITGLPGEEVNRDCLDFYVNEFREAKIYTEENPLAKEAVRLAREKAGCVVLSTNPIFPMVGQEARMSWVGLAPSDFDLVTSYESESFCKPNPEYFRRICQRIGVEAKDCLLVGNDEYEDMYAGSLAGLNGYLITDCMIASEAHPWQGARGSFRELIALLAEE